MLLMLFEFQEQLITDKIYNWLTQFEKTALKKYYSAG